MLRACRLSAAPVAGVLSLITEERKLWKERLLWEHSIGTAFGCRLLVQDRYPHMAEEAFLAGLMHDIGKLVLNQQAAEQFDEIVQVVYNENRNTAAALIPGVLNRSFIVKFTYLLRM